nr:MAG TPA: hypothetical protein [Caudoviricetes sp.]
MSILFSFSTLLIQSCLSSFLETTLCSYLIFLIYTTKCSL